jgi:Purple acid Phosphatase, N-terminal domain/Calcineurin-like phosphoesterase
MKNLSLFLLFVLVSGLSYAKTDFFRVMFNKNGDHEATIGWNQVSGDSAVVFWGKEDLAPSRYLEYSNLAHVFHANKYKGMENRFVRLINLEPNTAYYFVVKDNEGVSERFWFKTTPNVNTSKLSLVAGGDSRSRRPTRVLGFKMVGKLVPHAILFDGDYTDIDNETKWRYWFEDYKFSYSGFDNRIIPIITTRGNHEQSNDCLIKFFDCPNEKNVYNVTMGGDLVNVICLNTEIIFGGAQKKFLEQTLIEHENYFWQIPVYHRACRPHVNWKMKMKGVKQIYKRWIDLFEKHGVRLAIECDSHITKVTWPIKKGKTKGIEDGFIRDDENGIVYAGEGCWGAPLRVPDRIRTWTRDAGSVNSFKWIFVSNEEIEMRTVDYANADEIAGLTDETRFDPPAALKLWAPENGAIVSIKK